MIWRHIREAVKVYRDWCHHDPIGVNTPTRIDLPFPRGPHPHRLRLSHDPAGKGEKQSVFQPFKAPEWIPGEVEMHLHIQWTAKNASDCQGGNTGCERILCRDDINPLATPNADADPNRISNERVPVDRPRRVHHQSWREINTFRHAPTIRSTLAGLDNDMERTEIPRVVHVSRTSVAEDRISRVANQGSVKTHRQDSRQPPPRVGRGAGWVVVTDIGQGHSPLPSQRGRGWGPNPRSERVRGRNRHSTSRKTAATPAAKSAVDRGRPFPGCVLPCVRLLPIPATGEGVVGYAVP